MNRIRGAALLVATACAALVLPASGQKQQAPFQEDLIAQAARPWTGDLDGMIERRSIRALVPPARMEYWIDRGRQNGAEYELLTKFEEELNRQYQTKGKKHLRIQVHFIPTARDKLIPALLEGRGDIAAGILTVTPERAREVDFGAPFFHGVAEIVVTGPASPALASLEELSGKQVFVRRSSSFWTHLEALNARWQGEGRAPV